MGVLKSVQLVTEDMVEIVFYDDFHFNLERIKESYKETEVVTKGLKLKRLVICGKHTEIDKEARDYGKVMNEQLSAQVVAEALVVHSFTQKMITNLYLKYIQKSYPAKSFTDVQKAKDWLAMF
jgi:hypothetical protein